MIPCLGVLPPESIMPFPLVTAPSVSAEGTTDLDIPAWVRNVGRYSLLVKVEGGWGQSAEKGELAILDGSGATIASIREEAAISPVPLSADKWIGSTHTTGITVWAGGGISVTHGTWFLIEGLASAATVRLIGAPAAVSNPTTFFGLSVLGLGRGRRDPPNLGDLLATFDSTDQLLRVILS